MKLAKWFVLASLLLYSAYILSYIIRTRPSISLDALLSVVPTTLGAIGLAFGWPWSRYAIYLFSTLASLSWLYLVLYNYYTHGAVYPDLLSNVLSLIPGLFFLGWCAGISWFAARYFKKASKEDGLSHTE